MEGYRKGKKEVSCDTCQFYKNRDCTNKEKKNKIYDNNGKFMVAWGEKNCIYHRLQKRYR